MRKYLLAGVAFTASALVGSASFAADAPVFQPAPVAPAPAPAPIVYDWTGPYVGVHVGYGWGKHRHRGFGRTGEPSGTWRARWVQADDDFAAGGDFTRGSTPFSFPGWDADWEGGTEISDFGGDAFVLVEQDVLFRSAHDDLDGWFAGAQVGYNFMMTPNFLVGVEADFSWSGIKGSRWSEEEWNRAYWLDTTPVGDLDDFGPDDANFVVFEDFLFRSDVRTEVDWFGTFRGRIGVPFDNVLPYITGGLAWGRVSSSGTVAISGEGVIHPVAGGVVDEGTEIDTWGPETFVGSFSTRDTRVGWSLGAGVEVGLTPNASLKAEYLYVDLGSKSHSFVIDDTLFTHRDRVNLHTVKVGLNWRFASGGMGVAY